MQLYIMRHGDALLHARTDAERPLSDKGRRQAAAMVNHFLPALPGRVIASPYLRAQETCSIICEGLRIRQFDTVDGITPDDDPFSAIRLLQNHETDTLLMVSHLPLVASLVSLLVDGHLQGDYRMGTASLALLEADTLAIGMARLRWLRHPP